MVTYLKSIQQGLLKSMLGDERVYLLGEDILDPYGGAFKVTQGLSTKFPERVITTPISEAAIVGVANGMALRGLKPVVEIMFGDFITLIADQLINYAAKFRGMYNYSVDVPLVVRTPVGGGRGYGPTHSQSLEKIFLGIPHLRVIAPSIFHDPGSMLEYAIIEDNYPVLFLENKLLYPIGLYDYDQEHIYINKKSEEVGYPTKIVCNYENQKPDIVLITYGGISRLIPELFRRMAHEEICIVACLPGCLYPMNIGPIAACVAEAERAVVVEEGSQPFGWGGEVAAMLYDSIWQQIKVPIKRVAAEEMVIPAAKPLEEKVLPSIEKIEKAIFEVLV